METPAFDTIHVGDCREWLQSLPAGCAHACITDPPYEIGFMGRGWDRSGVAYDVGLWAEVLRVLTPGGHVLAFGGSRTHHRQASALEDAGFEIRDELCWLYGTGFPKNYNLDAVAPGWGTALKPAHEPITMARAPLAGTVAETVTAHGTGAIQIDACRIPRAADDRTEYGVDGDEASHTGEGVCYGEYERVAYQPDSGGRWPANVLLDEAAAGLLDEQSGFFASRQRVGTRSGRGDGTELLPGLGQQENVTLGHTDGGGASRFFYVAKPTKAERELGLDGHEPEAVGDGREKAADCAYQRGKTLRRNTHPTVKPLDLMRYLVRLVTPAGGAVLEPFAGSGTTCMAAVAEDRRFLACELSPDYARIATARTDAARKLGRPEPAAARDETGRVISSQGTLF